jgi:hypothetical protein
MLVACGEKTPPREGTVTMSPPIGVRAPEPGDPSCPRTGKWAPCALIDRIVHAGLSFKETGDSVRVPFIKAPAVRYRIAMTDTMLVFYFADSVALQNALAPLDTVRVAPRTDTTLPWPSRPEVIRSGNLLALYFPKSPQHIERVRLAITAGAPAPPAPTTP